MKVAIFTGSDEVIILAIKGRGKSMDAIDGLEYWFNTCPEGKSGIADRHVSDYRVTMGHIGSAGGILIEHKMRSECTSQEEDIEDWFPESTFYAMD